MTALLERDDLFRKGGDPGSVQIAVFAGKYAAADLDDNPLCVLEKFGVEQIETPLCIMSRFYSTLSLQWQTEDQHGANQLPRRLKSMPPPMRLPVHGPGLPKQEIISGRTPSQGQTTPAPQITRLFWQSRREGGVSLHLWLRRQEKPSAPACQNTGLFQG